MIEKFFEKVLELKNVPRQGWKEKLEITIQNLLQTTVIQPQYYQ